MTEELKHKQAKNLLTNDQKAIVATMRLFPGQTLEYLWLPVDTKSVDDEAVELVIKEGAFLIDIVNYFHDKHNICPDLTANISMFKMLTESIHKTINWCIELCEEDMQFSDEMDIFTHIENSPDEQFAKYAIDVREKFEAFSRYIGDEFDSEFFVLNPVSKNTDIFSYDYWISVFVDNVIRVGFDLELREGKYWE